MRSPSALVPVIPTTLEWPYTMRVVSDVLASNGSTSMASVCGSTLSLMDAGVPIKAPVAGIAMGLVYAEGKYTTLTDILGAEDAFGDMDFKVAGTAEFVTALQLDTKIDGIPADVLAKALLQAKEARSRSSRSCTPRSPSPVTTCGQPPKIVSFEIPVDKIGEVIGPKGKVINTIQQETGADISVQDADGVGVVSIGSKDGAAVEEAQRRIELILDPPTAEVGAVYEGRVVNITKFGAFVNILPGRDGLVHISKLGRGKRIDRVEDVLSLGDELRCGSTTSTRTASFRCRSSAKTARLKAAAAPTGVATSVARASPGSRGRSPVSASRVSVGPVPRPLRSRRSGKIKRAEFGDLGPGEEPAPAPAGGRDRGGDRRGGRGGRGGGGGRGRGGPRRS